MASSSTTNGGNNNNSVVAASSQQAAENPSDVPDKGGWLWKRSVGKSMFSRKNWKMRYMLITLEGMAYYAAEPFDNPKGVILWQDVTHIYDVVTRDVDSDADDNSKAYFGLRFLLSPGNEKLLLLRVDTGKERDTWVRHFSAMRMEYQRVSSLVDTDDEDEDGNRRTKASRRAPTKVGSVLESIKVKLRTMVSLKKQRLVKDGFDLDLAYITPQIVAMGFPAEGREAVYRNPYDQVVRFLDLEHEKKYRVYNLCSERAYPPTRFDGAFTRFPFDDHNPCPFELLLPICQDIDNHLKSLSQAATTSSSTAVGGGGANERQKSTIVIEDSSEDEGSDDDLPPGDDLPPPPPPGVANNSMVATNGVATTKPGGRPASESIRSNTSSGANNPPAANGGDGQQSKESADREAEFKQSASEVVEQLQKVNKQYGRAQVPEDCVQLVKNSRKVVAIHCKAGKGRTGLVICAYLMYSGMVPTAEAALRFFGDRRTKDGKGVQIPSQKRYLGYWETMLRDYRESLEYPPVAKILLRQVILHTIPHFDKDGGCDPFLIIQERKPGHQHRPQGSKEGSFKDQLHVTYDSRTGHPVKHVSSKVKEFSIPLMRHFEGEILITLFDQDVMSKDEKMCQFWIHTGFLHDSGRYTMKKHEIDDAVKDKKHTQFNESFAVTLDYQFEGGAPAPQRPKKAAAPVQAPVKRNMPAPTNNTSVFDHTDL